MGSGGLVAALDEVGHDVDHAGLERGDGLVLALGLGDVVDRVAGRFRHGLIEMLDLVAGADLDVVDALECFLAGFVVVVGEVAGKLGEAVDGRDDETLGEVNADGEDRDEEAHEDRRDLDGEDALDLGDVGHGDVNADIGFALAAGVIDRVISSQEPAVLVVGLDDVDLFAGEKVGKELFEGLLEFDDFTGLSAGDLGRVDVENNVTAVLPDLINIQVSDAVGALPDEVVVTDDAVVAVGVVLDPEVLVDHVAVDQGRGEFRGLQRVPAFSVDQRLSELSEADDGDDGRGHAEDHGDTYDDLRTERKAFLCERREVDLVAGGL